MTIPRDEQETSVTWDFALNQVRIYTTRPGDYSQIAQRLGEVEYKLVEGKEGDNWSLYLPMDYCRRAKTVVKVMGQ